MVIMYIIVGYIFGKMLYKKIISNKELEVVFNTHLIESITMFKNIKNLNKVNKTLKKIESSLTNYISSNFKIEKFYNFEFLRA